MPAFLNAEFWSATNPELWVGVGLLIFFGIIIVAGAPKMIVANLDAQAATIRGDLEEAARIRAEAEAMLADIKLRREAADHQAAAMIAAARADAERFAIDAKVKLEEQIARRAALAERKIATAEAQATAQVKAAAVDLATAATARLLAERLVGAKSDPMVDGAIEQLSKRFS
jgi:F-type H+-transporting ATPase subunit b